MKKWSYIICSLIVLVVCTCGIPDRDTGAFSAPVEPHLNFQQKHEYVGDQVCQSCHQEITSSYKQSGMGHSMYEPDKGQRIEVYGLKAVVYDDYSNFYYQAFWKENDMYVREFRLEEGDTIHQRVEKVNYIIGSGNQTRSYLYQKNGYLFELPITWYVEKGIWDLSPGYGEGNNSRFSRPITAECLNCHTGDFEFIAGSLNKFGEINLGIGCENCHGSGKAHVEIMKGAKDLGKSEENDHLIRNGIIAIGELPLKAQFDICLQCHLEGIQVFKESFQDARSYQVGMELNEVMEVFLPQDQNVEAFGTASHGERLQLSRCFTAMEGKLVCTTCHNPHEPVPSFSVETYVNICQDCHVKVGVEHCPVDEDLPERTEGNCVSCHMPEGGTKDIPHVQFHDHNIRVVHSDNSVNLAKGEEEVLSEKTFLALICATSKEVDSSLEGKAWLSYFERYEANPAYLNKAKLLMGSKDYVSQASIALHEGKPEVAWESFQLIPAETQESPKVMFLKGEILEQLFRFRESADAYLSVFEQYPDNIEAGNKYVTTLLKAEEGNMSALSIAKSVLSDLMVKNPYDVRLLSNLGFVNLNLGDLEEAESLFERALSLDPDYTFARENLELMRSLLTRGR